jgi:peptidoglycan/LPS O-acetylase OafA/YrhL
MLAVLFAALLFPIAYLAGNLSVGDAGSAWVGGFCRVAFAYPAGMLLHRLWCRRAPSSGKHAVLALIALPFVILCSRASNWWLTDPLIVVLVVPLIIWCAVSTRLRGRFAVLATGAGRLSYPLYALHRPVIALTVILFAAF